MDNAKEKEEATKKAKMYKKYRQDIEAHNEKMKILSDQQQEMFEKGITIDLSLYRSNYAVNYIHFKSLTPEEADLILYYSRANGTFLEKEIYIGLKDCMDSKRDSIWINALKNTDPSNYKELVDKARAQYLSTNVWLKFQEVIAPFHEEYLLAEIESTAPSGIDKWIRLKKSEGYFFTDNAYQKAMEKRLSIKRRKKNLD